VAREYGIPAVLGTDSATKHIQDGQEITVDGDKGIVTMAELCIMESADLSSTAIREYFRQGVNEPAKAKEV
jgi:pyruvate,water dikinase